MIAATLRHLVAGIVLALSCVAWPATAVSVDRDPLDVPLRQYAFLLGVALLGGVVSWASKVKSGALQLFNLYALIGELATSAFAGLLTFWICSYMDLPKSLTAALVGIAGHMGTRAIARLEAWVQQRVAPPGN